MDHSASVDVFKGQANLDEPVKDFGLAEEFVVFDFSFDVVAEVAHFAVLHDYY